VTKQGWIFNHEFKVWTGSQWESLLDIFGQEYSQAEMLGINDKGLAVAKIKKGYEPMKIALLMPVELISDLNNDGRITSVDIPLRDAAGASGATDLTKDKGTELMFHNDKLSNGAWDKEDSDPEKPANADDDDAEALLVSIRDLPDQTEVWLEHPASAGFKYYRDRKCTQEIQLSAGQRHIVGGSVSWPADDKVYVRAEGDQPYSVTNPELEGELVLKVKTKASEGVIEAVKIKLTVVKAVGAKKYFHAARDYIFESNSKLCMRKEECRCGRVR
jgi:hypothetical protein